MAICTRCGQKILGSETFGFGSQKFAKVSKRRIDNVISKFYFCDWFEDSITIVHKSFDLPTFTIKGSYRRNGKQINVMFVSKHPGGNPPRFLFSHDNVPRITQGVTGYSPAYFDRAETIRGMLIDLTN